MAVAAPPALSNPPLRRFKLAVHKSRILFYLFATIIALVYEAAGIHHAGMGFVLMVGSCGVLSAVIFYGIYQRWWRLSLDPLWFFVDAALVTWMVYATGGADSAWVPWYVASMSEAAVVGGFWWAVVMAAVDGTAYMTVLAALGQAVFPSDAFFHQIAVIVSLFCGLAFFLWGTVELQRKRKIIKQLKESESSRVSELTRLTEALDNRTTELAEANQKIRQADRLKSQFLANMSHELRTPLNSIIGFSEVLEARLGETLPPKERRYLEHIHTSGQHLLGLINDLLDLSKIEAGKMELHPERFPMEHVIAGVCGIMKGVAGRREVVIEQRLDPDLPQIEADSVKVKQILYNLLSNAVKFSPDGETVTVSARFLPAADSPLGVECVEVSVRDRGPGIRSEDHEVIFEEFRQAGGPASAPGGGTGLGLALVKKFAELHGGFVSLASSPGEGSTFSVMLPVQFPWAARRPEGAAFLNAEGRPKVLVVEDDEQAYETLALHLAKAGFGPVRARTGEEALRMVHALRPAAVTLDIVLPDMDGWEVLKKLKEEPGGARFPVVIVSRLGNRELGLALGADDYFLKPIEGEAFTRRLKALIPQAPPSECKLLVVDDDPKVHDLLEAILGDAGYRVEHALSGHAALELVGRCAPDLIVLDLLMEGMSGFEVAGRLSARPETASIPVVVLTAKELTGEERRALSGKISAMLQKTGTSPEVLVNMVRSLLQRRSRPAS